MDIGELLGERDHVLVALDGPIVELPAFPAAERLRVLVGDGKLPRKVARTEDPFVVLAHAATIGPATERAVHAQLGRIEHEVLVTARPAAGVRAALAEVAATGTQVTVVSSLAAAAVRSFLVVHDLIEHARHLVARTTPDLAALPPAPDLVTAAVHARAFPASSCLFVGARDIDLAAARAASVPVTRYRDRSTAEHPVPWFDRLSTPVER
jgi:beta-phosphoglucomutase-like phosphatase (HAD superfamily)